MSFGQELVAARKKSLKIFFGFFALLFIEFFVLTPLIGAAAMGVMFATFIALSWYLTTMTDPLFEEAGDLLEKGMLNDKKGRQGH